MILLLYILTGNFVKENKEPQTLRLVSHGHLSTYWEEAMHCYVPYLLFSIHTYFLIGMINIFHSLIDNLERAFNIVTSPPSSHSPGESQQLYFEH